MTPLRDQIAGLATADRDPEFRAGILAALEVIDHYESDRRVQSAQAVARLKGEGRKTGGDVPYGYRLDQDGTTLRESSSEQRVIATARALKAQGLSLRAIAQGLEERKMYPRSVDGERRTRFHAAQIRRLVEESE